MRDHVWGDRGNHIKSVRAILEEKIKERMRQGGYTGDLDPPSEEDFLDDLKQ